MRINLLQFWEFLRYIGGKMLIKPIERYFKFSVFALSAFLFLVFASETLFAHGVLWEESKKKAYGIEFAYDDGTVMGFAEAKVYGPNDTSNLYQTGRTNELGYFAFIPSEDGKWLVTADDANGHLCKAELDIKSAAPGGAGDGAAVAAAAQISQASVDRAISNAVKPYKMVTVILVLIALGLAWKIFLSKKGAKEPESGKNA
jgi:nickel transport protein